MKDGMVERGHARQTMHRQVLRVDLCEESEKISEERGEREETRVGPARSDAQQSADAGSALRREGDALP